jgi:hypothetical protein
MSTSNKTIIAILFTLFLITACGGGGGGGETPTPTPTPTPETYEFCWDNDRDGFGDPSDCLEAETPAINPDAVEIPDGIDNNCNGIVDEEFITCFFDSDEDGFGDPAVPVTKKQCPSRYVTNDDDCDDSNAAINPAATEVCNEWDDDCDGKVNEGLICETITYYPDKDKDSYGDSNSAGTEFPEDPGPGWSTDNQDCDDSNPAINPAATEICGNGKDENCNGKQDEGFLEGCRIELEFEATADTYTSDEYPSQNFGSETSLTAGRENGKRKIIFLNFEVEEPKGYEIESASLSKTTLVHTDEELVVDTTVTKMDSTWKESDLTMANQPTHLGLIVSYPTLHGIFQNREIEWDVTPAFTEGPFEEGFSVTIVARRKSDGVHEDLYFYSSESPLAEYYGPRLSVVFKPQ